MYIINIEKNILNVHRSMNFIDSFQNVSEILSPPLTNSPNVPVVHTPMDNKNKHINPYFETYFF